MHPHPRAANSKPRRRLSVSFPRTLLPGPQPPPRCPASSAAESSGRLARGSRVSWPNGDWTWRLIASGCGRFTTATSSPGTDRPTTGPKAPGQGGGATFPPRVHRDAAPGRSAGPVLADLLPRLPTPSQRHPEPARSAQPDRAGRGRCPRVARSNRGSVVGEGSPTGKALQARASGDGSPPPR